MKSLGYRKLLAKGLSMCPIQPARGFATSVLMVLAAAGPLAGQWRAEPIVPVGGISARAVDPLPLRFPDSRHSPSPDAFTLTMAGIAGAAVGTVGGAWLGYHADRWWCQQGCATSGYTGIFVGWFIGSALTTPLSVHLASGRRGSLSRGYLTSGLIAGAGMGCVVLDCPLGPYIVWGAPLAQVISAVLIERRPRP